MSSLRSRTRDAGWQWLLIGVVLGIGCSAVTCLGGYAAGLISLNVGGGEPVAEVLVSPTVLVSEVAELPSPTATSQVVIVTATSSGMTITQPSATPPPPTEDAALAAANAAATLDAATAAAGGAPAADNQAADGQPPQAGAAIGTPLVTPTPILEGEDTIDPVLRNAATELRLVSGGDYQMGTNQAEAAAAVSVCVNEHNAACDITFAEDSFPPHQVILDSFQMERYEVTAGQYAAFLNTLGPNAHLTGCYGEACAATAVEDANSNIAFDGTTYTVDNIFYNMPMTNVTWYGARAYCESLNRRLPTEAEWERAARGADGRIYPWGNEFVYTYANTNRQDDSGQPTSSGPVAVGSYPEGASPYDILDLAGNLAEWTQDWYSPSYYGEAQASGLNPQGPVAGTSKVVRGGSWDTVPFFARTVHRQEYEPNTQSLFIGFRCVSDDTPVQPGGGQAGAGQSGAASGETTTGPTPTLPPGG